MTKKELRQYIVEHTINADISYRGGSLKVDATGLFESYTGADAPIIGAYQNYLGGGIAGSIQAGAMFDPSELNAKDRALFDRALEACKLYFYDLNNGGGDDYMQENVTGRAAGGYKALQRMPRSAY